MSQALRAAIFTVTAGRAAHLVHGTFLHGGDGRIAVRYDGDNTRDGASFSSRRVVAHQGSRPQFVGIVSFHTPEPGPDYQMPRDGSVPPPGALPVGRYDTPWFEGRDVLVGADPSTPPHVRQPWFRARRPHPDNPALHTQALVYLTDHGATRAVREPHTDHPGVG